MYFCILLVLWLHMKLGRDIISHARNVISERTNPTNVFFAKRGLPRSSTTIDEITMDS